MKNAYDVLAIKEMALYRVRNELQALQLVAPLLCDEDDVPEDGPVDLPSEWNAEFASDRNTRRNHPDQAVES